MDNVKRAQKLLATLKKDYGIDPRDLGGAIAGYAINLGISVVQPDMLESIKLQLEEANKSEDPEDLPDLLDAANAEGQKALARRNLASEIGWIITGLLRNVISAMIMKGGHS